MAKKVEFQSHAVREAAATLYDGEAGGDGKICFNPMQLGKPLRHSPLTQTVLLNDWLFQSHAVREAAATTICTALGIVILVWVSIPCS